MATAGSIVIDLLMRTGSFETDSKRASKALKELNKESLEFAKNLTIALAGLAAGAAGAFLVLERGAAAIGKFKDLGAVVGDTGEALASLQTASDVSGVSMDTIAETSVKLTKALSKVDEESEGAAKALTALGIPLADFKKLSPVEQIDALSKALDGFADDKGATETMEALVRGGSRLIPLLKELRDQGGPRVIITQDQIDAADRFADSSAKLKSQVTQLGQAVLADLLPPFQAFVDEIGEADKALSIFSVAGSAVRIFFETITVLGANVIFVFKGIGNEIGGIAAQMVALATFDLSGFNAISKAMKEDAARARAELDRFEQRILGATEAANVTRQQRRVEDRGFDPRRSIDTSGFAAAKGDDAAKKLLDSQVKALESVIRREQDLLGERNRFLNLFNDQGLVSIRDFYDAQLTIIESATAAQVAAITRQIALTAAARDKAAKDSDRADLQTKVDELVIKRNETERKAVSQTIELSIKREQAEKRFAQQIETTRATVFELQGNLEAAAAIKFDIQNQELIARAAAEGNEQLKALLDTLRAATIEQAKFAQGADLRGVNASIQELQGNLGAAAAIRFDEQNFALIQRLTAAANTEGLALVQTLRAATIAQAEFGKASADTQRVTDSLAIAEDRISISRQLGATTELGALQQLGDARRGALAQLEAMVQAQEAIAQASKNPALILNAERARVELEKLRAVADPLGDKIRTIFTDAGSSAIETFISDVSKGKDAVKAFADTVLQQINRIVSQNISEQIFGKQGALGQALGSLGGLFGGGGTADAGGTAGAAAKATADTSAAAATTALATAATTASVGVTALAPALPPATAGLIALTTAAQAASVALAQIAAGKTADAVGEFIDFGAFFAEGGKPPVGKVSVGGERGRELFIKGDPRRALESMVGGASPVGGLSIIGQNGPEFFRPTVPGYVIPAEETEQILRRISGFGGAYAWGGNPPVGRGSLGGEDGRELFIPVTRGMAPPKNEQLPGREQRSAGDTFITVPVTGQVDRRTRHQIANDIAREQRAAGRLA
jgi:hypothetical protein